MQIVVQHSSERRRLALLAGLTVLSLVLAVASALRSRFPSAQ